MTVNKQYLYGYMQAHTHPVLSLVGTLHAEKDTKVSCSDTSVVHSGVFSDLIAHPHDPCYAVSISFSTLGNYYKEKCSKELVYICLDQVITLW